MADRRGRPLVRAAGGVVWRVRKGRVEVALVHRPRYDDWSLPKGKLVEGETELAAAVREVHEELGARVSVSRRVATVGYDVGTYRKTVTFWVMRYLDGEFEPNPEVDAVEWLRPKAARERLTYDIEKRIMIDFHAVPIAESVIVLVRHAKAGKRSEWRGADELRPLEASGLAQAEQLDTFLRRFAPDRVISAHPLRCVQTVQPFADGQQLDVTVQRVFSDEEFAVAPGRAELALMALAKPGRVTVVCSQGLTIPGLIERVVRGVGSSDTRKGAAWVLSIVDGTVVSADYYDDAGR